MAVAGIAALVTWARTAGLSSGDRCEGKAGEKGLLSTGEPRFAGMVLREISMLVFA